MRGFGLRGMDLRWAAGFGARLCPAVLGVGLVTGTTVPGQAAIPDSVCRNLGYLAERLTDYRNRGISLPDAVPAASRGSPDPADPQVATEIAWQVYATPNLSRSQEAAAVYAKCRGPVSGAPSPARKPAADITDLVPIALRPGPNWIARFTPDGRDGLVTLTWRDDDGGGGHDAFLVDILSRDGKAWEPVQVLDAGAFAEGIEITDDPQNDYDMLRSVRFARGKVDGQDAALLLIASRPDGSGAAPSAVLYDVFRLVEDDDRYVFKRIRHRLLPVRSCNADMALSVVSGLPLRSSYRGPRDGYGGFTAGGCPAEFGGQSGPSAALRTDAR